MKDKPVILVVDDQPQNIELLEAYLVPQGYEIVKAANGEEALGKLSDNPIDLILLDVKMPGMDGFEVTHRVRQDNTHRLLPIILVTALRETEDRVKGIEAGCDDFISHPVDKMELLARVRSLLKIKAYNDLMSHYQKELESEVTRRTEELNHALENLQQDITARKRVEAALRESETKYRNIVENAMEGIFQITGEGKCFLANTALVRMLGYESQEDLISATAGLERRLFVPPSGYLDFQRLLGATGYVKGLETYLYKKDGSKAWVRANVRAIYDEQGSFLYYQGTVEDMTSQMVMDGTTRALSKAIEIRDPYTSGHQQRVTQLAAAIAKEMGYDKDHLKAVETAGLLHDLGKIYVPAEFLSKPGGISLNELSVLRDHSKAGYEILKDIEYQYPIAQIVLQHHERMNGSGYPQGLSGDQILQEARIIGVADVVESMASHRPYRPSRGIANALNEIEKNRGTLYDEAVVDTCLKLFREKGFRLEM